MSVADQFGLDDPESPLLTQARTAWARWCKTFIDLAVVDDLAELRGWTRQASASERDIVFARLATLAADDPDAAVALVWLLVPGAVRLANRLRDLSPDIDALVAGQLWLEVHSHGGTPDKAVAFTILQNTRRAILTDHGIGGGADRRDRTWAHTVLTDRLGERAQPVMPDAEPDADLLLCSLVWRMLRDNALTVREIGIVASAADHADWLAAPMRGRAGLTAPDALEVLTWLDPSKSRTMRRTVGTLLDRIAAYAREHGTQIDEDIQHFVTNDDWTFGEFVMIAEDPKLAPTLRRFNQTEQVRIRCPATDSVDSATSEAVAQCACAATGGCPAQAFAG